MDYKEFKKMRIQKPTEYQGVRWLVLSHRGHIGLLLEKQECSLLWHELQKLRLGWGEGAGEEPGCEALLGSKPGTMEARMVPAGTSDSLYLLHLGIICPSSFRLPLLFSLSRLLSYQCKVSSESEEVGSFHVHSFLPRLLFITHLRSKMLSSHVCRPQGVNSPPESEPACPRLYYEQQLWMNTRVEMAC